MKAQNIIKLALAILLLVIVIVAIYCILINVKASKSVALEKIEISEIEHIDINESVALSYKLSFSNTSDVPDWAVKRASNRIAKKSEIEIISFSPDKLIAEATKADKDYSGSITVTGLKNGEAKYAVKCGDISYVGSVIVGVLEPASIVAPKELFVAKGKNVSLSATVYPKYADDNLSYEVSDSFVATVDKNGNVSFISTGETEIKTITSNGLVAVTKVTAAIEAESFSFNEHKINCSVGTVFNPGFSLVPEYVTYGSEIMYSSDNENVVRYDEVQKAFVTVGPGTAEVVGKFMSGSLFTDRMTITVIGEKPEETVKPSDNIDDIPIAMINEKLICNSATMTKLAVNTIKQKPELPNGCEITSATIALNYLGYKVDKVTMADTYLDCEKPYYSVDPEVAYMGNPHNTGWYCFGGVIEEAVNEYFSAHNVTKHKAYDITGSDFETLKSLVDEGTPVVFWATLYFNAPYRSTKFTLPDGSYPYSNLHCLVMTGYDDSYVYIEDPLGLTPKVAIDKFINIYEAMGKRAVKIVE